jgi:hypothetical protein
MPKGYVQIMVDGRKYLAHRLAWLWMTGVWPDGEVDHWDTNGANNAWANLRAATRPQQLMNASKRSDNTSGYKGVSFDPRRGTWYARVESNGRKQWIGSFPTPEAAKLARDAAADLFHGDFARNE